METSQEKKLDATQLPPAIKHQTIFDTFEQLKEGESFILQNDHDPKPLYYQLSATKGDIFTWDYLKQGPDAFDIRIAKKILTPVADKKEDKILDGISLDPSVKFQTIMKTFNDLKEGEAFILHNDHDPKPLYYQLSATKGDIFTWDYLKQGPDVFDIRIAKKILTQKPAQTESHEEEILKSDHILFPKDTPESVRTIVAFDYRTAKVFRKLGIDYAWKGNRSLKEVCQEVQISETELRNQLSEAQSDYSGIIPSNDYYHWDMAFMADHILGTHHRYVKENAEKLSALAEEAAEKHGADFPELAELGKMVRPMIEDFMVHMSKEEDVLFPAIKQMLRLMQKGEKNQGPGGAIKNAVAKMEAEHDETRISLEHFRDITHDYRLPNAVCSQQGELYQQLQMFENDTYLHVHLENNILFPKLIILESLITEK